MPAFKSDKARDVVPTVRLIESTDQAYVAGLLIALDAHAIPHIDLPAGAPWAPATLVLVREPDLRRAMELVRGLQRTPALEGTGLVYRGALRAVLVVVLVGFVILFVIIGRDLFR